MTSDTFTPFLVALASPVPFRGLTFSAVRVVALLDGADPKFAAGYRFRPVHDARTEDAIDPLWVELGGEYFAPHAAPSVETAAADIAAFLALPPSAPAVVIPEVTRRQLFLWLNTAGHTRADLRALLVAIPDASAREAALIEFDEAQTFKRTHPLIIQLADALGFTSEQTDAAFLAAAGL